MEKEVKKFSDLFVAKLGLFVDDNKTEAIARFGLSEKEFKAIMAETFYLLGRNHEEFKKEAGVI